MSAFKRFFLPLSRAENFNGATVYRGESTQRQASKEGKGNESHDLRPNNVRYYHSNIRNINSSSSRSRNSSSSSSSPETLQVLSSRTCSAVSVNV